MNKVSIKDFDNVMSYFKLYKDLFPHVRTDNIKELIEKEQVILENGVLITYNVYQKKTTLGNVFANKNDAIIHQIVNKDLGSGNATSVINDFFKYVDTNVFLTVRQSNLQANKFYKKVGMDCIGKISWSDKSILGNVYVKSTSVPLV